MGRKRKNYEKGIGIRRDVSSRYGSGVFAGAARWAASCAPDHARSDQRGEGGRARKDGDGVRQGFPQGKVSWALPGTHGHVRNG